MYFYLNSSRKAIILSCKRGNYMKAVILAAGYGKRLRPITNTIPKGMVQVNGTPLLVNALNNLVDCGIKDIAIVVGHMADYIVGSISNRYKEATITYFDNKRYRETNNVVSFYLARDFMDDDFLLLECDLYYRKELLEKLISGQGDCSILVSPYNPRTMKGTVVRVSDGDQAREIVPGKWQSDDFDYYNTMKTVNMYRFTKHFINDKFMPLVSWYVKHMSENSYYEEVLGGLLYYRECDIRIIEVPETEWCEIDDMQDLAYAESKFSLK